MKIISLQAENVKKLVAVEIRPDGNLVEITGRNGQGKTSVLDSIWWALAGSKHIQSAPIRKGATEARIRLDLGELVVSRRFWKSKDGTDQSSIAVENAEGARYPSPQKMIDALLGELSFDPLSFARMDPKEQFDALKRFVPGVDFEAIANADRGDRERRTELNRLAKQERAAAQLIIVPPDTPSEPIDESALVQELAEAGEKNTAVERRRTNRENAVEAIRKAREVIAQTDTAIALATNAVRAHAAQEIARIEEQIAALQRQRDAINSQVETEIAAESQRQRDASAQAAKDAEELQRKLDAAGPLPELVDVAALSKGIEEARAINANVRKLEQREQHRVRCETLESQSEEISIRIEKRQADKLAAIAAAKMPVPGLDFGEDQVLLNGVPFEQASDAEQLRASVAIAMALNPKLRVIRIRDGSLLDADAMCLLAEMAEKHDMQVWIERVDGSGKVGFVLEDGHARHATVVTGAQAVSG